MKNVIIVREFNLETDNIACQELLRNSVLSYANSTYISFLFKEVVLQVMVLVAAVSFIFLGLPIVLCLSTIPLVGVLVYVFTYTTHAMKAADITQIKPMKRWVAEAFEPYFMNSEPSEVKYGVFNENEYKSEEIDTSTYCSKIVGVVGIKNVLGPDNGLWLYGLAVNPKYFRKGISKLLVENTLGYAQLKGYDSVECVTTEFQPEARLLFQHLGFQMKQIYHRYALGIISIGKFQQIFKFNKTASNNE